MITTKTNVFPIIEDTIKSLDIQSINQERKETLQVFIDFIQNKVDLKQPIRINFICTHNSRRSHLSQVWAQTMAAHFNINKVSCYSGGTEATALFPRVEETLKKQGFEIFKLSDTNNSVYTIKYSENEHPVIGFSKKLDDDFNPKSEFAAIMTCDSANEACPFVPGAEKRIPIMFEDPKAFDNTPLQAQKYLERSEQIASEMYYIFSQIKA